jgi:hypothetical protein
MAKTKDKITKGPVKAPRVKPQRFAHPFFTNTPIAKRAKAGGAGKRMTDYVATKLEPIPAVKRDPPVMTLDQVIGQQGVKEIIAAKSISFHSVGDTGHENGQAEELVAEAMALDYDPAHPETSPAFFLHLGDVIYYNNTDQGYLSQFYVPYKNYPGKIIAIPGNHDGEMFKFDGTPTGQKVTLGAFQNNFCMPSPGVPPSAGTIYREMISQPGVYWVMNAPFVDIVGLYSNMAEGPGFISSPDIGTVQKVWLAKTLTDISNNRKKGIHNALLITVHHPPFSNGGHSSSVAMLADIDEACNQAGILPDVVLAAHAHNYQRYTRVVTKGGNNKQIPFIVAGTGGRGTAPVKPGDGSVETDALGTHIFNNSFVGYGYLKLTVTAKQITIGVFQVNEHDGTRKQFETISVDLATNNIVVG